MRPARFRVCRAEFIHGDCTRVKRTKFRPVCRSLHAGATLRGAPRTPRHPGIPHFCRCFAFTRGRHADRPKDLAERMRTAPLPVSPPGMPGKILLRSGSDTSSGIRRARAARLRRAFRSSFATSERRGAKLPDLLLGSAMPSLVRGTRARNFSQAESSTKMKHCGFFSRTQSIFRPISWLNGCATALPKILAAAPPPERDRSRNSSTGVASSAQGCYALIDYVNFKGEGILLTERYHGRGWGLMQVLARRCPDAGRRGSGRVCGRGRDRLARAGGELAAGSP